MIFNPFLVKLYIAVTVSVLLVENKSEVLPLVIHLGHVGKNTIAVVAEAMRLLDASLQDGDVSACR